MVQKLLHYLFVFFLFTNNIEKTKKLKDLVETRRFIEISVTELAVCRATDQQRKELLELAESFHPEMDPEEFRNLNHRFHMKIGECCANPLLEELYGRVLKAVLILPLSHLSYMEV